MSVQAPTTAERIRSACARGGGAVVAVEGLEPSSTPVHHLLSDGSFAITVPANGLLNGMIVASAAGGVQAVLELTDYAPLPLREPVRSLVWIRGRLHHVPPTEVAELLDLIAAESPEPAAGYRVADRQVTRRFDVLVDGVPREATVRADLLLQKNGRTFVAEIKAGWLVSDPMHAPTRRQLLEYEVAFGARGVLLVDVPRKAVRRVEFPLAR